MRLLLCFATFDEVRPFTEKFGMQPGRNLSGNSEIFLLESGVGMVATALNLGAHLVNERYDLAINAGIAGTFRKTDRLGTVFNVVADGFPELGAEDDGNFLSISTLGFGDESVLPIVSADLAAMVGHLPRASAITVNKVHGRESSIAEIVTRIDPHLESMEGAAFFMACRKFSLPATQLRAVSNYVERRNREAWKIGDAVHNLNMELENILKKIL